MAMTAAAPTPTPTEQRPKGSAITNYFLVILFVFGCVQLFMNIHNESTADHHQQDHIKAFQDKFLVKSHSKSRKTYPTKDDDVSVVEVKEGEIVGEAAAVVHEEEADYRDDEGDKQEQHYLAGLSCERFGGPADASEMVYWEDIPSDNTYISPFQKPGKKQYLTFEADHGGWNNIRMAMETVMTLAVAMGRTLVLPPSQKMYLLSKEKGHTGAKQRGDFSFANFFHMESIADEHEGLEVITMKEFLEREGLTGNLRDMKTNRVVLPPKNQTDYDGANHGVIAGQLERYLQQVGVVPSWDPEECLAAFPSTADPADVRKLEEIFASVEKFEPFSAYVDKPFPVDAPPDDRMRENWAERKSLCIYDEKMQDVQLLHFSEGGKGEEGARLLVHFYAFLFFEDWRHDLWMKRFVRDHVRYIDEIQCAAARIIEALREKAKAKGSENGDYNAYHIRRGDFQYTVTRYDAPRIIQNSMKEMTAGGVVYIATDEKNKAFFDPFRETFDTFFLDDFMHLLEGVNSNYFGMIDSLIAARSNVFFGCWFSTFTGYINRLRGYHNNKKKGEGYEMGYHSSYYYALDDRKYHLQEYYPVKKSFYAREFPTSWRLLDTGIGELQHLAINKEETA